MERHALYFSAPQTVDVRLEPLAAPTAGEVLVRTLVSAISSGTELLLYRDQMPRGMVVDATIEALAGEFAYPLKYGYAAVGEVVALGADVDEQWHGRRVFAFQPHQSHFLAKTSDLLAVPEGMDPETAVLLPNMETAVSFLMDAQPLIGEQVAVFGQGVVGLLTTGLLAQMPLAALVTLDRYPLRREWSRRLGAHAALDPGERDTPQRLEALLQGQRPYRGADLTLELSGNPAALEEAIAATGYNGRVLVGSWYGQKSTTLHLGGRFHRSHMRLISSQVSHIAPQWQGRFSKARRLQIAWEMLAQQRPERLITHRFALDDAAVAYDLLHTAPQSAIQVVFTYPTAGE